MPSITGSFKLVSTGIFSHSFKADGFTIIISIINEEDEWTMRTVYTSNTTEIKFKLGEEFDEIISDGRSCKSVITKEGEDKLVHVQKYADGRTLKMVREFSDTEMKMTLEAPGMNLYRIYERQ